MSAQPHGGEDLREKPIGELLRDLSQQTTTLVRQELDLAKAEVAQKGQKAGKGAGLFGGAGVIGFLALAAFTFALIMAIDKATPNWVAGLIVAAVYGAIAGFLALQGKNKLQEATPPAPEQTVETLKEDVEWAKTQTRSGAR